MEVILLSFVSANTFLIILWKAIGMRLMIRYQLLIDIVLTLVLPFLFIGTYSGMATAIIAGLIVTIELACISIFYKTLVA